MTPTTAVLQLTTRCPYRCPQCYMQKGTQDMAWETAKHIIDRLVQAGGRLIQLTGGEPAVYPQLERVLSYAHGQGLYCVMATSGYGGDDWKFYSRLKRHGLDMVCVSINALDEAVDRISRDSFVHGIRAIKEALAAGLCVGANVVVSDDNVEELSVLIEYLVEQGVAQIFLLRPIPSVDGAYHPAISRSTLQIMAALARKWPTKVSVEHCFKEYWEYVSGTRFVCDGKGLFYAVSGRVSPCSKLCAYAYDTEEQMLQAYEEWRMYRCDAEHQDP